MAKAERLLRPPTVQHALDLWTYQRPGLDPRGAAYQQLVIAGVGVTHRSDHRGRDGVRIKRATCRASLHLRHRIAPNTGSRT